MKRNKNETPAPIILACRAQTSRKEREQGNHPVWDILPEKLYKGIQPTLAPDHLHWQGNGRSYFIPARILLELARLWKDEPYFIRATLDLSVAILQIESGWNGIKFTSRTEIKCVCEAGDAEVEYACRKYSAVPFAFDDGSDESERLRASESVTPSDPWILKAVSKDDARPSICIPWGDFATDGIRAHIDRHLPPRTFAELEEYERPSESDIEHYRGSIARLLADAQDNKTLITIDAKELAKAVKLAKSTNKETVHLFANGRLDVWSESVEFGDTRVGLEASQGYNKSGPDAEILIDPRFLTEALAGFTGEVLITLPEYVPCPEESPDAVRPSNAVYLTDGAREALIMPKRPD